MDRLLVTGGNKLKGIVKVGGAKNVAMKVILAGLLTDSPIIVSNIPMISSVKGTIDIVQSLGIKIKFGNNHQLEIKGDGLKTYKIPMELGGLHRTASMVIGPLLARYGKAIVPNPGGCRIGRRPIDRHIDGLKSMGAKIAYKDGYFYAEATNLHGTDYKFENNTHTGTETLILAAVLAQGETILRNCAEEPEVDDLIRLLILMGAKIKRKGRMIIIKGVKKLGGANFSIMPDRNEAVTFAIAGIATGGEVIIEGAQREYLIIFLEKLKEAGAGWEVISKDCIRFYSKNKLKSTSVTTSFFPGFMTDWQAPWALLMTQAQGISCIHEAVYEDRFGYIGQLLKMGAKVNMFNPKVDNPKKFYNFNWSERDKDYYHAIKIYGPKKLHNAILEVCDLRAGATLLLSALIASGESVITGIDHVDRGYENIDDKLTKIGAKIKRFKE